MSVIGYFLQCDLCNVKMLVTVEAKHSKFCPDCLEEFIRDAIDDAIENDHLPPEQVIG
jgi:hypothetical protein